MLLFTVMSDAMGDADRDLALLLVGPVVFLVFFLISCHLAGKIPFFNVHKAS